MVPWILIIVGLAVMYQVAQRSGLLGAVGGIAGAVSGGGGRSAGGAAAGARPGGGLGEVLAAVVSGPNSGEATGGGKGISGVNASPVVGATPVASAGPSWGQPGYDYAPGPQKVTVPGSIVSGPATGMPVGARVIEYTDARANKGQPQLISLANGMSASEFARQLAQ